MLPYEPLLQHAVPYLLVSFRLAGLFLATPILASTVLPMRVRALLVLMSGAAVYPAVPAPTTLGADLDLWSLLPAVACEALIGICMGVIASLPLVFLEAGGTVMGQMMGFGLARVYNPETDTDMDVMGQTFFYIGAAAFLAMDGLEALFAAVLRTFGRLPIGALHAGATPLDVVVETLTSGFELALRVGAPVAGVVLLLIVLFAAIGKTMPQINIMSVGFTVKIIAGLSITVFAVRAIDVAAGDAVRAAVDSAVRWADSLHAPALSAPRP
jgi:flagellar biosynthetic protein FliR